MHICRCRKANFVSSPSHQVNLNWILVCYMNLGQRIIYGNYAGSRKDMKEMLAFSAKHNIESIVDVMPFSCKNEAIQRVKAGQAPMRLVLENED